MKFILGKKMAMTQMWVGDKVMGVTPIKAGPCVITQIKNKEKDGYEAVQLAIGVRKEKNIKKPQLGHFKKADVKPAHVREFRSENLKDVNIGDFVNASLFSEGDIVNVTGTSKGKGFQGVVKRHGFGGFRATHGNKDQERMPGSIGATGPAHVFKGMKMPGRTGNHRITTTNLNIVKIDVENNIIYVNGSAPGAINGLVMIKGKGDFVVNPKEVKVEAKEEAKVEAKEEAKVETKVEKVEAKEETKVEVKEEAKVEVKEEVKAEAKEEAKVEAKEENKK